MLALLLTILIFTCALEIALSGSSFRPKTLKERFGNQLANIAGAISLPLVVSLAGQRPVLAESSQDSTAKRFQTRSGLKYYDIIEGSGVSPKFGQLIAFNFDIYYKPGSNGGKLEKIDSSSSPFLHKHGNGRICRGLDEAIHTMRVGGKRRAVLPKEIGISFPETSMHHSLFCFVFLIS
jgi:hypothetical protein